MIVPAQPPNGRAMLAIASTLSGDILVWPFRCDLALVSNPIRSYGRLCVSVRHDQSPKATAANSARARRARHRRPRDPRSNMNDFDAFLDIQRAGDVTAGRLLTDDIFGTDDSSDPLHCGICGRPLDDRAHPLRPPHFEGSDRVSTVRLRSDLCRVARKCPQRCRPQTRVSCCVSKQPGSTQVRPRALRLNGTRADAHAYLFEFNEVFYNRQRHQPGLGHLTPAEYADKWRHGQGHPNLS